MLYDPGNYIESLNQYNDSLKEKGQEPIEVLVSEALASGIPIDKIADLLEIKKVHLMAWMTSEYSELIDAGIDLAVHEQASAVFNNIDDYDNENFKARKAQDDTRIKAARLIADNKPKKIESQAQGGAVFNIQLIVPDWVKEKAEHVTDQSKPITIEGDSLRLPKEKEALIKDDAERIRRDTDV